MAAFIGIIGGADGAGEAQVDRGTNEPTEATFDLARGGQGDWAGGEVIVGSPSAWGFGEGCRESQCMTLVQFSGLVDEGIQVKGSQLLQGQRDFLTLHRGSSSKTSKVWEWSHYGAAFWLI